MRKLKESSLALSFDEFGGNHFLSPKSVYMHGSLPTSVAEIVVIRDVAKKLLHPLQNEFMAFAVRASESSPMVYPSKQLLDYCVGWRQKEVQGVVSGHSS